MIIYCKLATDEKHANTHKRDEPNRNPHDNSVNKIHWHSFHPINLIL